MTTAATFPTPSAALAALFSSIGRGILWVMVRAVQAPLTSAVAIIMTLGVVSATSNALFMQERMHPAPMFGERAMVAATPEIVPQQIVATPQRVVERPQQIVRAPRVLPQAPAPKMQKALAEITHADIKAMQEKLAAFGLYTGKADGFYGPNTASAIRAFEAQHGLTVVGALTPEVLTQIRLSAVPNKQDAIVPAVRKPTAAVTRNSNELEQIVTRAANDVVAGGQNVTRQAGEVVQKTIQNVEQQVATIAQPDRLAEITQKVAIKSQPNQPASANAQPARANANDPAYVKRVQAGLASLGFLQGPVDGVAGEDTARAIRNFEVYYNYNVTGAITPDLIDILFEAGAKI